MFGIGPTELMFFLVIVLLAVGPEKLPTFMRTVGKGVRQVRNASREFKEAIGLDELMREGDPFRSPPLRQPRTRPVPVEDKNDESADASQATANEPAPTAPPPPPPPSEAAQAIRSASESPKPNDGGSENDVPTGTDPR